MCTNRNQFRHAEHRLLWRTGGIPAHEILSQQAEQVVDVILEGSDSEETQEKLDALLDQIGEPAAFPENIWEKATEHLTKTEREAVTVNINRMDQRNGVLEEHRDKLSALKLAVESSGTPESAAEAMSTEVVATMPETQEKKGFLPKWKPEYTRHVLVATGAVAAGAAIVWLAKTIFGKAKAGAEATSNAAKSSFGFAKFAVAAGVIGILGYFGITKGMDYWLEIQKNGILDKLAAARKIGDALQIEKLEKRLAAINAKLGIAEDAANTMAGAAGAAITGAGAAIGIHGPEGPSGEPGTPESDAQRTAEILAYATGTELTARAIIALEEIEGWDVPRLTKILHIRDFLEGNSNVTMGTIFASVSGGRVDVTNLNVPNADRDSRENAIRSVVAFCKKKQEMLTETGMTEEEILDMKLSDYLKETAAGSQAMGKILLSIEESGGDLEEAVKNFDMQQAIMNDPGMQEELRELAGEGVKPRELLTVLSGCRISVNQFLNGEEGAEEFAHAEQIREILKKVKKETHQFMLPFFHKVFPDQKWSSDMKDNLRHAETILLDRMPVHQAIRMYLYAQMMRKGNPTGVVLMQSEVFAYTAMYDNTWTGHKKTELGHQILQVAAGGTWEGMEDLSEYIDDETVKKALENVSKVGKVGIKALAGSVAEGARGILGFITGTFKTYPKSSIALTTILASGIGYKGLMKFYNGTSPHEVSHKLGKMVELRMNRSRILKGMDYKNFLGVTKNSAIRAHGLFDGIRFSIRDITEADELLGLKLNDEFAKCTSASARHTDEAWAAFIRTVESHKGANPEISKILTNARKIKAEQPLQRAIAWAARPVIGPIREAMHIAGKPVAAVTSRIPSLRRAPLPPVDLPAEISKLTAKARGALSRNPLNNNVVSAMNDSPRFARTVLEHLDAADDPDDILRILNGAADSVDDPTVIGKIATNNRRLVRLLKEAEKGGDFIRATSKTAKIMKGAQALGVAADAFAIYASVMEMQATSALIEKQQQSGNVNEELISKYRQRYAYLAAEIGIAGTGAVAGTVAVIGVGGTVGAVAGPVALATLPVSAVLYGAYEGHKWEEDKTRTADDWKEEYDLISLITDSREYTTGEWVGHQWDQTMGDGEWVWGVFGAAGIATRSAVRYFNGDWQAKKEKILEDLQGVNIEKIKAIVAHTTTVTIPETVRGEDGEERPLTTEEVDLHKTKLQAYVDAKAQFIHDQASNAHYAINSGADITVLMRDAEYYGKLVETERLYKAEGMELPEWWPSEELAPMERAKIYAAKVEREQLDALLLQTMALQEETSALNEESNAAEVVLKSNIQQKLSMRTEPILIDFYTRCREENFVDWWMDGDAIAVLQAHLLPQYEELIASQSEEIAKATLADLQALDQATDQSEFRQHPVEKMEQGIENAIQKIDDLLLDRSPKKLWESISEEERDELRKQIDEQIAEREEAEEAA